MDRPRRVLVNGAPEESVPVTDRGLLYGDGVFETVRVVAGRMPLWPLHRERLHRGADRLGIGVDVGEIERQLRAVSADIADAVVRVTVTRGDGPRGFAPPTTAMPRIVCALYAPPRPHASAQRDGVRVRVCSTRLSEQPLLAGIKHLNRLEQVLARREWPSGSSSDASAHFDEGLMLDLEGRLVEGTFTNVFMLVEDRLVTPELSRCGVAGVMRRYLLEQRPGVGQFAPEVRDLRLAELVRADECFLSNSVSGIWPVRTIVIDDSAHTMPAVTMGQRIAKEVRRRLGFPDPN
jgi:4-amino-4-deoxychorismate lyase